MLVTKSAARKTAILNLLSPFHQLDYHAANSLALPMNSNQTWLEEAMSDVTLNKLSLRVAAKKHRVEYATTHDLIEGSSAMTNIDERGGKKPCIPMRDNRITDFRMKEVASLPRKVIGLHNGE